MRMPTPPPPEQAIWQRVIDDEELRRRVLSSSSVNLNGPYYSWDEVRRRPPPDGLTHDLWWLLLKMKRKAVRIVTPFLDTKGQSFWFCEPNFIRTTTRNVDLHWGGALSASSGLPTPGEARTYLVRSLAEEPFSSSFLEGAATTREIAKELIFKDRAPRTRDERMVLNNYRALLFVRRNVEVPLSTQLILDLHKTVTEGTLDRSEMAGVFRGSNDQIEVYDEQNQEILHTPPSSDELEGRIKLLCDFANDENGEDQFIHPVIRAIIIHFMIGYDHPFIDGNGRTARALFYWMMMKSGYWLAEFASISSVIKDSPVKYGRAYLDTEVDECDLTYFICNQCDAIATSENRIHQYIEKKRKEVDSLAAVIERGKKDGGFNHRQTALLNDLVRRRSPAINISRHQNTHSVSYHTARNDLEELTERGLLSKRRLGRDTVYYPAPGLDAKLLGN